MYFMSMTIRSSILGWEISYLLHMKKEGIFEFHVSTYLWMLNLEIHGGLFYVIWCVWLVGCPLVLRISAQVFSWHALTFIMRNNTYHGILDKRIFYLAFLRKNCPKNTFSSLYVASLKLYSWIFTVFNLSVNCGAL